MKIALVSTGYPSYKDIYNLGFIHTRVKNYVDKEFLIDVYVIAKEEYDDEFEGVYVRYRTLETISKMVNEYDGIFVHFLSHRLSKVLNQLTNKRIMIWVHGAEVISFRRRLFTLRSEGLIKFTKYALWTTKQRLYLRKYLKLCCEKNKVGIVYPSNWMKKVTEEDLNLKIKEYRIIPNPIDNQLFAFKAKNEDQRFRIVSIRSFNSYKYGTDILQNIIIKFINDKRYQKFKDKVVIEIYGDGILYEKETEKLRNLPNVKLNRKFLLQSQMAELFKDCGIFINTTRQDAQGVTMCEAMQSGLVTVNSYNTAIPEFVLDRYNGFLCKNVQGFVDSLYDVIENPKLFQEISLNAHKVAFDRLNIDNIVTKELSFFESLESEKSR